MNSLNIFEVIIRNDRLHFRKLIEENESVLDERSEHSEDTTLHIASRHGHTLFVSEILKLRPDLVVALNAHQQTPIHAACIRGSLEVLDLLLLATNKRQLENSSDNHAHYLSCLQIAISHGHVDVVQNLIQSWPSVVEKADENGRNLLHYACKFGQPEIVRLILKVNPKLSMMYDNSGFSPLHIAVVDNIRSAEIFHEFDVLAPFAFHQPSTMHHDTILHLAVRHNQTDVFLNLMQILGDSALDLIRSRDKLGNTLLHLAVSGNFLELGKYLITKSTEEQLRAKNEAGRTALDILHSFTDLDDFVRMSLRDCLLQKLEEYLENKSPTDYSPPREDEEQGLDQERLLTVMEEILDIIKTERACRNDRQEKRMQKMHMESLQNARNTINILAILIATVTFTGCLSPPGGFFQQGINIGKPVLGQTTAFKVFAISNDIALFLSLIIVIVLASIIPFRTTPMRKLLRLAHKVLWLAVSFLAAAFIAARWATTLQVKEEEWMFGIVLSICGGLLGFIFVGLIIKLVNDMLKKAKWRKEQNVPGGSFSINSDMQSQVLSGYYTH